MLQEFDYSKLIGRTYQQADCWEIIRDFYWRGYQIELQNYAKGDRPKRKDTEALISSSVGDFEKVKGRPQFGDLIVIKIHGIQSHIAIYVGNEKMFHSTERTGSVIEPISRWENIIVGYYRLKGDHQ